MADEHPMDTLGEGLRCLIAIHDLLLTGCDRRKTDLHLVNAECLCTLIGVVRHTVEEAYEGLCSREEA